VIAVELDLRDLDRQLNAVGAEIARPAPAGKFFGVASVLIRNDLKENLRAGRSPDGTPFRPLKFPRPNGKTSPLWDTGALARSVGGAGGGHVETRTADTLTLGTNLEYAGIHQDGGEVTPKTARWLTIPLTAAAKRAGGARNFPAPLYFVPLGRNKAALRQTRQAKGKRGKAKTMTHYLLVKKVTIPARPFIGFSPALVGRLEDAYANLAAGG